MNTSPGRVCPVERAGALDSKIRKWFQHPRKILTPYLKPGMTVLDFGCGPGFFTIDMAQMVGDTGQVIASDLQPGMLEKLQFKIRGTDLEKRIRLHVCKENAMNIETPIDFFFSFYVLHEVPDQEALIQELHSIMKSDGKLLIAEPPIHVSRKAFQRSIDIVQKNGFTFIEKPVIFLSKTAVFKKDS